jgi:hypothetical protein
LRNRNAIATNVTSRNIAAGFSLYRGYAARPFEGAPLKLGLGGLFLRDETRVSNLSCATIAGCPILARSLC